MGSLLKGTVRGYNALNGTAEVEIVGSHGQYLTVPVATHLDGSVVSDGKRCAILSFAEHNPSDAVLVATYDDVFGMGSGPLANHDHSGDSGDGGQLNPSAALLASGDEGDVLTIVSGAWSPAAAAAAGSGWTWGEWTATAWDGDSKTDADGTIDLSSTFGLPAGIKAVSLQLAAKASVAGRWANLVKDAGANSMAGVRVQTHLADYWAVNAGIVECDANGDIRFTQSGDLTGVYVLVNGYLEEG